MATLIVNDLVASKELDSKAMAGVVGGMNSFPFLDASTTLDNKVADVKQAFGLGLSQDNAGALINNQAIEGGNGIVFAPVDQSLTQSNFLDLFDIGNTSVS